jgi:hypothetical protein
MNKSQLRVLWAGIGILALMGLFPPLPVQGYGFIFDVYAVSLSRLCIECAIVAMVTGGLIYSLKVDPDLMLKIPCLFSYLRYSGKRSFEEIFEGAKKDKTNISGFWWVVLVLLSLALVAIRLLTPAVIP